VSAFTGTGILIRFILRRDRLRLPIWIIGIVGFFVFIAASFPTLYPTEQERQGRARLMENPAALAFRGPGHGLDDYTYGAILSHEMMGFATIAVALMSIFLVVRHTRSEEERGRLELIRAAVVGRHAAPAAALAVVIGANVLIAALFTLLLPVIPGDYSVAGSIAFGLALSSVGIVFAGVAAVTSQLSEYGRGASSMAGLVLGVTFLLRAIGDVQENVLSWLSPIGWAQATRAFVDERWWPLLLSGVLTIALFRMAFALIDRRDVASGIMSQKPGRANASGFIQHPIGFALRQQRGSLIGWIIGLTVVGVGFGALAADVEEFIADNPQLEDYLAIAEGVTLLESFLGLLILVMSFLATGFAIQATLRARTEETEGRVEPLLATALARPRWMGSYLLVAMFGSALILLAGAGSLGATAAINQRDSGLLVASLGAALAYVPVLWLLIGLAALLFGFLPRAIALPWLLLIYGIFVGIFGELVQIPDWMFDLSPYEHVPELPGGELTLLPIAITMVLAALLIIVGLVGFRRRDLHSV
jgi:ABC-2 type transport system permease protein